MATKRPYEIPSELAPAIGVMDKYGILVTSTTGGKHNKGSKHYTKEAFDIDHRKLQNNPELRQKVFGELSALGYGVIDETVRPKGQKEWGGMHYHVQKGYKGSATPVMAPQLPTARVTPLPVIGNAPPAQPMFGSWDEIQAAFARGESPIRPEYTKQLGQAGKVGANLAQQATNVPSIKEAPAVKYEAVAPSQDISSLIDEIKNAKLPETQPIQRNALEQFGEGVKAPFMGYSNDVVAQQEGGALPYQAGNFLGQVGAIGIPTVVGGLAGGPIGGLAGSGLAQGVIGERSEAQRERLAGEPDNIGKRLGAGALNLGLGVIPGIGAGMKLLPRLGLNAALQGGLGAAGDVGLQAIEQGTIAPQLDVNRTLGSLGLGAAGGAAGGLLTRGAPKPVTVKAPRVTLPQQGPMKAPRVVLGGIEVGAPVVEAPRSTLDPTNPASYGLPETPKVKQVEYATPQATPVEGEQLKLFGPKGVDAALYDAANSTPETNPTAWAAAREGLQEYGDLNIQEVAGKVRGVVDSLPPDAVTPEGITKRLVAPEAPERIANAAPRPQTPDEIIATSRKLSGTVDEMIAQGTEATPIKTREQYANLKKAYSELNRGIGRYNKDVKDGLIDLSDLTPEVMVQRGGMLNDMINTGQIIPQARVVSPKVLQDYQMKFQQLLDGNLNAGQTAKMQQIIADMEYRAQLQSLSDQMETIHPEVRKAWEFDYDPQTKLALQKAAEDPDTGRQAKRFEDVSDGLPEILYNRGKMIEDAAKRGASLRIDADTEITGATSRISQREVTPLGFFNTKDGHVGFTAYNDDGHLASYYITPKASSKTGMISQVKSVEILGSEKFRGEYANVYLGPREFRIDDILKRPPRLEGVTTSQARQTLRKAAGVFNDPELQALNPRVKQILDQINKNPDRMTIEDVNNIEELLRTDKKVLKAACEILGRM